LKVKIKANEELIKFLAQSFQLKSSQVTIKTGHTSARKIIEISQNP